MIASLHRPRFSRLCVVAAGVLAGGQLPGATYPVGHDFEGLPQSVAPMSVYSAAVDAPLNRLHALLFLAERTPTEIGATLPAERRRDGRPDEMFFNGKWALMNRKGADIDAKADTRAFGGDVRTSPVKSWTPAQAAEVRQLLSPLATPASVEALGLPPLARLSLQWDLLQVWWRFEREGGTDAGTLLSLARAVQALGQPRPALEGLPSGLERFAELGRPDTRSRREPRVPVGLMAGGTSPWVEVDRESKALFQAQRSLAAARAFIKVGDRAAGEALVAAVPVAAAQNRLVEVPRGAEVALVLTLVGLSTELEPVATSVVSEVRLRMAMADDRLDPASDTSTRDGWNQWVWLFSRRAAFVTGQPSPLRFVPDTAQSLFLEYGTPKHSSYFAQCSLCHRTTNGGNQNPSGVNILGRYAKPSVLVDASKRLRDAEREMAPVVKRLRERLAGTAAAGAPVVSKEAGQE